jgi:RimJ/RimL family protein N-acetyltransferase
MIKHARITLRHITEADLPLLVKAKTDPEAIGEHNPARLSSPHSIHKRFADTGFSTDDHETLLICDEHGAVIGNVLHFTARRYSTAREIGWVIHDPQLRGRGYAGEAVTALVDYLFKAFPINRIECCTSTDNLASLRLAEKCGFIREGVLRGMVFVAGRYVDDVLLSMLRADWEAARARA